MYIYVCMYIYIYTHTHTYTHTYMHRYIYVCIILFDILLDTSFCLTYGDKWLPSLENYFFAILYDQCMINALNVWSMNFFIWRKNTVSFSYIHSYIHVYIILCDILFDISFYLTFIDIRLPPIENYFCHKMALNVWLMNFFYVKKKYCFVLNIFRFLCFWRIQKF